MKGLRDWGGDDRSISKGVGASEAPDLGLKYVGNPLHQDLSPEFLGFRVHHV